MRPTALLVLLLAAAFFLGADEPPTTAPAAPTPFTGKITLVLLGGEGRYAYLINSTVTDLGGRPFLTGETVDPSTGKVINGYTSWIPIDRILRLSVFDNHRALLDEMRQQEQREH